MYLKGNSNRSARRIFVKDLL